MSIKIFQFFKYPLAFFLLLFSGSILNGQDFNPCPLTITLDEELVTNYADVFHYFSETGNLDLTNDCSTANSFCSCDYYFPWVRTEDPNSSSSLSQAPVKYSFNLRLDPLASDCDQFNWDLPNGLSVDGALASYRIEDYRIITQWGLSNSRINNNPIISENRIQTITEGIAQELKPITHSSYCSDPSDLSLCPKSLASAVGKLDLASTSKVFRDSNGSCETEGWKCHCDYILGDNEEYFPQLISFAWIDKSDYVEQGDDCNEFFARYDYPLEWSNTNDFVLDANCLTLQSDWFFYRDPEDLALVALYRDPLSLFSSDYIQSQTFPFYNTLKQRAVNSDCSTSEDIDLISNSRFAPQCSTETFNTLVKNSWPEIGDDETHFFLVEADDEPEEDIEMRFYLSRDAQLSEDDQILTDVIIEKSEFSFNSELNNFSAGGILDLNVDGGAILYQDAAAHLDLDAIPSGLYYIIEHIDPLDKVMEPNEGNNISLRPSPILISEFKGGFCDCCPQTITDTEGNIGELITEEPSSMHSPTGGRVIYLTNADAYSVSCGYRMKGGGSNGASFEIGHISWQDDEPFIRSTVSEGANDEDFCDFREFTHDVRGDLALLGFYDRFTTTIPITLMEAHNRLLANAFEDRVAPRNKICNADCEEVIDTEVVIFDANPMFITRGIFGGGTINNIKEISDEADLEDDVKIERNAVSCDGVSELLLRVPVAADAAFVVWKLEDEKYGKIETPWASRTVSIGGQEYVYAIYTPPEGLMDLELSKNEYGILSAKIPIEFSYEEESQLVYKNYNIELVAPPVVLVHGTFDNPDTCWRTPLTSASSRTLPALLEIEGFKVSTVDYQGSNGSNGDSFLFNDPSSFKANRFVVYSNTGGIKEAISMYRSDYNIAATRADVVGHSMGGVLPRVYAATENYKRSDNFNAGDINRLITIASTHHGSDLAFFGHFFNQPWSDSGLPLQERLARATLTYRQWIVSGKSETAAVRDQLPASVALRAIGATEIPSHAIVCYVDEFEDIRNDQGDQVNKHYEDLFESLASVFYYFPGGISGFLRNLITVYNRYPVSRMDLITRSSIKGYDAHRLLSARRGAEYDEIAKEVADLFSNQWRDWQVLMDQEDDTWIINEDRYLLDPAITESNYFDTEDNARDYIADRQYEFLSGERRETPLDVNVNEDDRDKIIDYLRYLIFRNDLNDGVVSYQSQAGGLSESYISPMEDVLHGYAPRYPKIINRVSALLQGAQNNFAPAGFPVAGRRLPMEIPDPNKLSISIPPSEIRVGDEAACWSGMVPSHAYAFARIAGEQNTVILARPVNPDATPLIDNDSATKGMKVKGKSSNWGPQKGYIAMDQTYSKIWQQYSDPDIRQREIDDYTKKVQELLDTEPNVATVRPLEVIYNSCEQDSFAVYYNTTVPDAEQSLYLGTSSNSEEVYYKWDITDNDGCPIDKSNPISSNNGLQPLEVLANPDDSLRINGEARYYTADYDLLAIGRYNRNIADKFDDNCPYPNLPPFDKETGLITDSQKRLLNFLNNAVREDAGYMGGNVSHHGPENQFYVLDNPKKGSPYVDYPITAFYPSKDKESNEAKIMSIPRGPAGFRDIYLKRFMAEKRREGYDLYDNIHSPGWNWRFYRDYSYDRGWAERDAPYLADSPAELPFPDHCDAYNKSLFAIDDYQEDLNKLMAPIVQESIEESLLFPNPTTSRIRTKITSKRQETINYKIVNSAGNAMAEGEIELSIGRNPVDVDVTHLPDGMYYFIISSSKKMISKTFVISR